MALPNPQVPTIKPDYSDMAQVSVMARLPEFWKDQPRTWFIQVEAVLAPQKMGDEARYHLIIAKLNKEVIAQVTDILTDPPACDKYNTLKKRLLEIYEESEERKIKKLIGEMELGDQKPSQLLRRMKDLALNRIPAPTLQILWQCHLPNTVQAILAVTEVKELEKLATVADKIMETSCNQITEVRASTSAKGDDSKILSEIAKVTARLARLETASRRDNKRYRSRTPSRNRNSDNWNTQKKPDWQCFYHFRYGKKATKCVKPCSWERRQKGEVPEN